MTHVELVDIHQVVGNHNLLEEDKPPVVVEYTVVHMMQENPVMDILKWKSVVDMLKQKAGVKDRAMVLRRDWVAVDNHLQVAVVGMKILDD